MSCMYCWIFCLRMAWKPLRFILWRLWILPTVNLMEIALFWDKLWNKVSTYWKKKSQPLILKGKFHHLLGGCPVSVDGKCIRLKQYICSRAGTGYMYQNALHMGFWCSGGPCLSYPRTISAVILQLYTCTAQHQSQPKQSEIYPRP